MSTLPDLTEYEPSEATPEFIEMLGIPQPVPHREAVHRDDRAGSGGARVHRDQ
ncbi:MAG: hypothetical protein QOH31_4066, partial [Verrucomicrobiota bacterium]